MVEPGVESLTKAVVTLYQSPSRYRVTNLRQVGKLTPDALIIAVHEALERVASIIDPNIHTNKLTNPYHALNCIYYKRSMSEKGDIIHQERLNCDLDYLLEMAIIGAFPDSI